jgi:hypothetical protein
MPWPIELPRELEGRIYWHAKRTDAAQLIQRLYRLYAYKTRVILDGLVEYMDTFATMDSYDTLEVVVWSHMDGTMEVDLDVRTGAALPPLVLVSSPSDTDLGKQRLYIASLAGDTAGGVILIYYNNRGQFKQVYRKQYKRVVGANGVARLLPVPRPKASLS